MLTFDEPSHTYRIDGQRVPSVTQVLAPLQDFGGVPPEVLARKAALGTDVHLACELDDAGELDDGATDPMVMHYVRAWRAFRRDTGADVVMCEQRLGHAGLRYAGTLDRVVRTRTDEHLLIDLKTSVCMTPVYGVQLAGYQMLLESSGLSVPGLQRKGLQLRPDETYRLITYNNTQDRPCFMGLLALANWKGSNDERR